MLRICEVLGDFLVNLCQLCTSDLSKMCMYIRLGVKGVGSESSKHWVDSPNGALLLSRPRVARFPHKNTLKMEDFHRIFQWPMLDCRNVIFLSGWDSLGRKNVRRIAS